MEQPDRTNISKRLNTFEERLKVLEEQKEIFDKLNILLDRPLKGDIEFDTVQQLKPFVTKFIEDIKTQKPIEELKSLFINIILIFFSFIIKNNITITKEIIEDTINIEYSNISLEHRKIIIEKLKILLHIQPGGNFYKKIKSKKIKSKKIKSKKIKSRTKIHKKIKGGVLKKLLCVVGIAGGIAGAIFIGLPTAAFGDEGFFIGLFIELTKMSANFLFNSVGNIDIPSVITENANPDILNDTIKNINGTNANIPIIIGNTANMPVVNIENTANNNKRENKANMTIAAPPWKS